MHRIIQSGKEIEIETRKITAGKRKERKKKGPANKSSLLSLVPASIGQPCRQSGKQSPCPIWNEGPEVGVEKESGMRQAITLDTTPIGNIDGIDPDVNHFSHKYA